MDEAVSKQLEDGFSTLWKAESEISEAKSEPDFECIDLIARIYNIRFLPVLKYFLIHRIIEDRGL